MSTPPPPPHPHPKPHAPKRPAASPGSQHDGGAAQGAPPTHMPRRLGRGPAGRPRPQPYGPANVTVVRTAEELQQATLVGATDIEVREHLDLTSLRIAMDPTGDFSGDVRAYGRSSLLYSYGSMRSIRGNCTDPNAAKALGLSRADAAGLLPLRPFQCLLRTHEPLLTVNNGKLWLDNVYLLLRRSSVRPRTAFIAAGTAQQDEFDPPGIKHSDIYVTNVTFHGEPRGSLQAYFSDVGDARAYFGDCIFNEWAGLQSPISIHYQAVTNIVDSVFRNMHLSVEIADVSYGSTVRFQNVLFANVTLEHGHVVSTTANDYHGATYDGQYYYASDDSAYDVDVAEVAPGDRGMWGADYVVVDDLLSDCIFLGVPSNITMPGCPDAAVAGRERFQTHWEHYERPADEDEDYDGDFLGYISWLTRDPAADIGVRMLDEDTPWFVETQAILPARPPPPPQWPPFTVAHPAGSAGSSSLRGYPVPTVGQQDAASLVQPLLRDPGPPFLPACAGFATERPCSAAVGDGAFPVWVSTLLPALVAAALISAIAVWVICRMKYRRRKSGYLQAGAASRTSTGTSSSALLLLPRVHGSGRVNGSSARSSPSIELAAATAGPHEARLRALSRQLDRFTGDRLLLGRFELLGASERRYGGSTVVQFARDTLSCKHYAVKFFLDPDAFATEATLFAAHTPALRASLAWPLAARASTIAGESMAAAAAARPADSTGPLATASVPRHAAESADQFLPEAVAVSDGTAAALEDPSGQDLPPCMVTVRGESLLEWSNRATPDQFGALSILSSVSLRLASMHASGCVHRNVKPTSIVLMSTTERWALCSFAHAARIGDCVPLHCTLAYAAPESVHAFERGDREICASPAQDAWALGVLAFELLTAAPAFDMAMRGKEQVLAMLRGDKPLPWEGEHSTAATERLGALAEPVLLLLRRDPAERGSARHFNLTCSRVFANRTTINASGAGTLATVAATAAAAAAAAASGRTSGMASVAGGDPTGATTIWIGDAGDLVGDLAMQCCAVTEDSTCTTFD
eukprot:jgi/Ulvmu1/2100/UM125_0004.1